MRRITLQGLALALVVACLPQVAQLARAQEANAEKVQARPVASEPKSVGVYRLEYPVGEVENGKRLNARRYMVVVEDYGTARIRVGSEVPISVGENKIQYRDVGINFDCKLVPRGDYVMLETSFESSSVVPPGNGVTANTIFRRVRAEVTSAVPPGKPTEIGSFDDVSTNRRYEIEVTATKIK